MYFIYLYFLLMWYLIIMDFIKRLNNASLKEYDIGIIDNITPFENKKTANFFINIDENDKVGELINCIITNYKGTNKKIEINCIKDDNIVLILEQEIVSNISININTVDYDKLMSELTMDRFNKITIAEPKTIYLVEIKLINGDVIEFYEFYNRLKNSFKYSIEKVDEVKYEMDLINRQNFSKSNGNDIFTSCKSVNKESEKQFLSDSSEIDDVVDDCEIIGDDYCGCSKTHNYIGNKNAQLLDSID